MQSKVRYPSFRRLCKQSGSFTCTDTLLRDSAGLLGDGEVVGTLMSCYQIRYSLELAQESAYLLGRLTTICVGN